MRMKELSPESLSTELILEPYHCYSTNKKSAKGYFVPEQTQIVGSMLGWLQMLGVGRMNGQKTAFLYHAMPKAGPRKIRSKVNNL